MADNSDDDQYTKFDAELESMISNDNEEDDNTELTSLGLMTRIINHLMMTIWHLTTKNDHLLVMRMMIVMMIWFVRMMAMRIG